MFENNCEANFPNGDPGEGEYYVSFYNKKFHFAILIRLFARSLMKKKEQLLDTYVTITYLPVSSVAKSDKKPLFRACV